MRTKSLWPVLSFAAIIGPFNPVVAQSVATKPKPNIVLIVADDLGYGDLGCYGAADIRTPNLDRLSREGVRLTDCYAAAPVCSPTRAALLTGRYPQRAGFEWVVDYGDKSWGLTESCLAKKLKAAGYVTGLVGKWHLGYMPEHHPNSHGFDRFFGFLGADIDYYQHLEIDSIDKGSTELGLFENRERVEAPGYMTDVIADRAARFVKENSKRPFFLYTAFNAPHWPFQKPDNPKDVRTVKNYGPRVGTRADYVAMVERLDAGVGQILGALADQKVADKTLVVFTGDNGGERLSNNGPLFHGKYTLWEGGLRVPCLVRRPGLIPAGTLCRDSAITMDLTATALAAAGVKPKAAEPLDGENLLPMLTGKPAGNERTFFWRVRQPGEPVGMKAVRRGSWKYVLDRRVELLFDLESDPAERVNLAYSRPEVVANLRDALAEWEKDMPKPK